MKEHTSIRRVDNNSLPNFSAEVKEGDTFVFQHGNHRIPHRAYDIPIHGGDELSVFNMSTITYSECLFGMTFRTKIFRCFRMR